MADQYQLPDLLSALRAAHDAGDEQAASRFAQLVSEHPDYAASQKPVAAPTYQEGITGQDAFVSDAAGIAAPPEMAKQTGIAAIRYGAPVVAGIATGGMGFLPAAALMSAASAGGEAAAQFLEKETTGEAMRPRETLAAGAAGMAAPVKAGGAVANFLANAFLGAGSIQAAKYIREGEKYERPKADLMGALEVGGPIVAAGLGAYAARQAGKAATAEFKADEIMRERGSKPTLAEIFPEYTDLEAAQYQKNNPLAVKAVEGMPEGIGPRVAEIVKDAPNPNEVAQRLQPEIRNLDSLNADLIAAKQAASDASIKAQIAASESARDAASLEEKAREAGVNVVKKEVLSQRKAEKLLGSSLNSISDVAINNRIDRLGKLYDAAKKSVSLGIGELYKKAGIGLDDPVAPLSLVKAKILEKVEGGAYRTQVNQQIDSAIASNPDILDASGNLTLAGKRLISDEIASGMAAKGQSPSAIERVSSQAYDAINSAMEEFIGNTRPESLKPFIAANKANAAISAAKRSESKAIEMIGKKDIAGFISAIESEGYGPVAKDIEKYATALKGIGDEASREASIQFVADVHAAIRDHLIDTSSRAGQGVDELSKIVDVPLLVKRLDALRQKGILPENIGLGNEKSVMAMARVAANNGNGMSADDVTRFLDDVTQSGVKYAEAKAMYEQTYRKFLIAQGIEEKRTQLEQLNKIASRAQLKAGELNSIAKRANNDPLVRLFNEPGLGIMPSVTGNSQYVGRVLDAGPDTVKRLVNVLQEGVPGNPEQSIERLGTLDLLRKSAVAQLFGEHLNKSFGPDVQRADISKITDFFYSPRNQGRREALKQLVGPEAFSNLEKVFGKPSAKILERWEKYKVPISDSRPEFTVAFGLGGAAQGKSTAGRMKGVLADSVVDYIQRHRYNTLYGFFVNPETAKSFAQKAYNLDAWLNASPRNAMLYRSWEEADRRDKQAGRQGAAAPTP